MTRRIRTLPAVAFTAAAAVLALVAVDVQAEISTQSVPAEQSPPALAVVSSEEMQLQCWQQGIKIIDETEVGGISVRSLLDQNTVSFGGAMVDQPTVIVLSLEDSTCLIRSRE